MSPHRPPGEPAPGLQPTTAPITSRSDRIRLATPKACQWLAVHLDSLWWPCRFQENWQSSRRAASGLVALLAAPSVLHSPPTHLRTLAAAASIGPLARPPIG